MDAYWIITAFVVIDTLMERLGHRSDVRAQSQSDPTKVYEVENLFVIPAAMPQVTYEVYLPLVQR